MKVYSIGREVGCDIVINDSTDVISRRHAILNVTSSGKMTITDQSHNGTYVNGIRISSNVPVPVTRKDSISFAHVARLDWNVIPRTTTPLVYAIAALALVLIIVGGIFCFKKIGTHGGDNNETPTMVDSVSVKQTEVNDAKIVLKDKISEAIGLKSAITNTAIADTLGSAIKVAQETYDNVLATKDKVEAATEMLQKAIDVAKEKNSRPLVKPQSTQQPVENKCPTCKKKISACEYKGKHPATPKEVTKCGKCGKPVSECEYKGNHPSNPTSRSDR